MKKFGISLLAVLVVLGLMMVMVGCGGDDDKGLPKSDAEYLGENEPARIDSTTAQDFFMVPWDLTNIIEEFNFFDEASLSAVYSTSGTINGSAGGTLTYEVREEGEETATRDYFEVEAMFTFADYADDGSSFNGVLAADGSIYYYEKEVATYTGEEVVPAGVGEILTLSQLAHQNYSAFYLSDEGNESERSGWMTMEFDSGDKGLGEPWEGSFKANIALADFDDDFFLALLGAGANLAWDGSVTTYSGHGTVCVEGEADYEIIGCFDVVFDMKWDENGYGEPVEDYPFEGFMEFSTINASAMFEFGYTTTSDCPLLSVDGDGDGVYEWAEEYCVPD